MRRNALQSRPLGWALAVVLLAAGCARAPVAPPPGQSLGIASVPNLRDLGGYGTTDGKVVASGMVYRSNQLAGIPPADMERIAALRLVNAFDLRTAEERARRPDELPPGVHHVVLDVLADSSQAGPAQLEKLMADPGKANEA